MILQYFIGKSKEEIKSFTPFFISHRSQGSIESRQSQDRSQDKSLDKSPEKEKSPPIREVRDMLLSSKSILGKMLSPKEEKPSAKWFTDVKTEVCIFLVTNILPNISKD